MINVGFRSCTFDLQTLVLMMLLAVLSNNGLHADFPAGIAEKIQALVNDQLKRPGAQSISIGTTLDGQSRYFNGGLVDIAAHQLPDEHTVYEVGSISKTITGTLLAEAALGKKI